MSDKPVPTPASDEISDADLEDVAGGVGRMIGPGGVRPLPGPGGGKPSMPGIGFPKKFPFPKN